MGRSLLGLGLAIEQGARAGRIPDAGLAGGAEGLDAMQAGLPLHSIANLKPSCDKLTHQSKKTLDPLANQKETGRT